MLHYFTPPLRLQVSDGIIAPGYTPGALEILKAKKSGAFVILAAKPGYKPPAMEYREVYGACECACIGVLGGHSAHRNAFEEYGNARSCEVETQAVSARVNAH